MAKRYEIYIPKHTTVWENDKGKCRSIQLLGDCCISGARRAEDGGYKYRIGGIAYYASAGTVHVAAE